MSDFLLGLEELPLRLWLQGFHGETARVIAHQWHCSIRAADTDTNAYRVRLTTEPNLRFQPPSPARLPRQVRLRTRTAGASTELRMSGARMRFTSGQSDAKIEIHPNLIRHPGLMELAVGGPLGHALALGGASFLHGTALVVHELPILALGEAGAGKSTVAAAAIAAGGTVVSDDSLVLYPTASGGLAVRTLRRNLFLREGSLRVLPRALRQQVRQVGPSTDPRWELDRQGAASVFRPALEPAVLCVLRQDRRLKGFRITSISQARALTSILGANGSPHLLHPGFPSEQQCLLDLWSRLTSRIPAFELRVGSALLDSPEDLLRDIVTRLRERIGEAS